MRLSLSVSLRQRGFLRICIILQCVHFIHVFLPRRGAYCATWSRTFCECTAMAIRNGNKKLSKKTAAFIPHCRGFSHATTLMTRSCATRTVKWLYVCVWKWSNFDVDRDKSRSSLYALEIYAYEGAYLFMPPCPQGALCQLLSGPHAIFIFTMHNLF